jgi:hypothetical protein
MNTPDSLSLTSEAPGGGQSNRATDTPVRVRLKTPSTVAPATRISLRSSLMNTPDSLSLNADHLR